MIPTLAESGYDTEWGPRSLDRLTARLRSPLPRYCVNPKCGQVRKRRRDKACWEGGHDLCQRCLNRWRYAGCPPEGVPDPLPNSDVLEQARSAQALKRAGEKSAGTVRILAANAAMSEKLAARVEDFAFCRDTGCSVAEAGRRVGVKIKTAERYEAKRIAEGISGWLESEEWASSPSAGTARREELTNAA